MKNNINSFHSFPHTIRIPNITGKNFNFRQQLTWQSIQPTPGTCLYSLDDDYAERMSQRTWYQEAFLYVRRIGKGCVAYATVEERDPLRHICPRSMYIPYMNRRQKTRLVHLLRRIGLVPWEFDPDGLTHLVEWDGALQWHGPLYSSGPVTETTDFFKLVPYRLP